MSEPELRIDRTFGRSAFGTDPASYHTARPRYPEWVFTTLVERCGLTNGTAVFEIGAGTGKATRHLLDLGASPLIAIEPDPRSAAYLRSTNRDAALQVIIESFEQTVLHERSFDLGICGTAFHWLDEDPALRKIARLLRPGGWWAMLWNVLGDDRPDPFHEATKSLLQAPESPSAGERGIPFALDIEARVRALRCTGAFDRINHRSSIWSLELDPQQIVALYATFSNINAREDRQAVLSELERIARAEFYGHVRRNMTTILYTARREPTDDAEPPTS